MFYSDTHKTFKALWVYLEQNRIIIVVFFSAELLIICEREEGRRTAGGSAKPNISHSSNLKQHIHTHAGWKPYSCKDCEARYFHRSNLKLHITGFLSCHRQYCCPLRQEQRKDYNFTFTGDEFTRSPPVATRLSTSNSRNVFPSLSQTAPIELMFGRVWHKCIIIMWM